MFVEVFICVFVLFGSLYVYAFVHVPVCEYAFVFYMLYITVRAHGTW